MAPKAQADGDQRVHTLHAPAVESVWATLLPPEHLLTSKELNQTGPTGHGVQGVGWLDSVGRQVNEPQVSPSKRTGELCGLDQAEAGNACFPDPCLSGWCRQAMKRFTGAHAPALLPRGYSTRAPPRGASGDHRLCPGELFPLMEFCGPKELPIVTERV